MPSQNLCTVVSMDKLNEYAYYMVLECGDLAKEIRPGQFLHIKCGHSRLLRRPISICLWMEDEPEDTLSIVFEVRGEGTQWLSQRKTGDQLDVLGPLGNGFTVDRDERYLLVGGGIGVPPLLGCATASSTAVLGFRNKDRAILTDRFEEVCQEVVVMSDDGSLGQQGFVDAGVRSILAQDRDFAGILACGPKVMLKNVVVAAAEFGIPCQVSLEERMGCGVGACLVCAVPMADGTMKHVCKDGPVFDAREVDWND